MNGSADKSEKARGRRAPAGQRLAGHFWTVGPSLFYGAMPVGPSRGQPWSTTVVNDRGEDVVHTGRFCPGRGDDSSSLVVILHGLGGTVERGYCRLAAAASERAGLPSLRLALRGADGVGRDLHHAGFVDDLKQILSKSAFASYQSIGLVGYSLGGHVALTAAVRQIDERIGAVSAVCPPLDLKACQQAIDARRGWVYRHHLLKGLKQAYRTIATGRAAPTPYERIKAVSTLREWDALTVVPRFGFGDVENYYRSQSVGPKLGAMETPTLVVASAGDPIVPAPSLRQALAEAAPSVVARWVRGGGHVFFSPGVDIGFGDAPGLENQIMHWLGRHL